MKLSKVIFQPEFSSQSLTWRGSLNGILRFFREMWDCAVDLVGFRNEAVSGRNCGAAISLHELFSISSVVVVVGVGG